MSRWKTVQVREGLLRHIEEKQKGKYKQKGRVINGALGNRKGNHKSKKNNPKPLTMTIGLCHPTFQLIPYS